MSLRRYSTRAMQQRPGRTILTLLSIVIGVAAAVWIDISAAATQATYRRMFAAVTGKSTLVVSAPGGQAIRGDLLSTILATEGVKAAAPVVEKPTTMTLNKKQIRLQVMGIDPALDGGVRDYEIVEGRQIRAGDEVVFDEEFARPQGIKVGDQVGIRTQKLTKPFTVVGLLKPRGAEVLRQASLAFLPIDRAQFYFYPRTVPKGSVDRIQVVTADDNAVIERVRAAIAAQLPADAPMKVERPSGSSQLMEHTLKSSEIGLEMTSLFSLFLASFIILNTFLMNVGERRRQLAIMRAIGATRWQLALALVGESLLLGVVGTMLGIVGGLGAAWLSNAVLRDVMEVNMAGVRETLTIKPFLIGTLFGLGMSVIGALIPAVRVGQVSPLEGMSRVAPGDTRNWSWSFFGLGVLLMAIGGGMIYGGLVRILPVSMPMYGGLLFLAGIVALQTVLLMPQATLVSFLLRPFRPVETSLALKQVLRHNTRSALTVGVLFVAGAAGVGMANSIIDNVNDVHDWERNTITADYYIRAMMPDMARGTAPDLPEAIHDELKKVDHITLEGVSYLEANVQAKTAEGEPEDITAICIARQYNYNDKNPPSFDLIEGNAQNLREQLFRGEVVIGSVLAQRLHAHLGDEIQLETTSGIQPIRIAAVTNEYLVGGMSIHMERSWAEKRMAIEGYDAFVIRAAPGYVDAVKPQLADIATRYDIILKPQAEISRTVSRIVGGVEWGLWVLVLAGFVVAAFGVVNTLSMNVLEQTRELGLLRIVAMTKTQVRRTIVTQALIIGAVGLPPGIAMGVFDAYVMNLSMMDSFGHPIQFEIHPLLVALTLAGSLIIILVSAIIPAYRATQINVVEALHYE